MAKIITYIKVGIDHWKPVDEFPYNPHDWPVCEECDEVMQPFTEPESGVTGFGCDTCGWSV